MTKILLAIITIVLSPFIMNNFSVKGISVDDSQLLPFVNLGSNEEIEDCLDFELETIIKMLRQMKKKLEKCEKQKGHNRLIEKQSPDLTFVDKSLARNLALFGKSNRQSCCIANNCAQKSHGAVLSCSKRL